jgi:death-on-curing protein
MEFLEVHEVEDLHDEVIHDFGGSPGLRDRGLLESAVARAHQIEAYEQNASVARLAAALSYGLIKNHAFIDGNKRVGYAALVVFLDLNGFRLSATEQSRIEKTQQAAAGEITEHGWQAWIEQSMQLVNPPS